MVLKRKRSSSELSSSTSCFGSSPIRPDSMMDMEDSPIAPFPLFSSPHRSYTGAPGHLPSRTMKRFRDNRPSEHEVHQRTLNMLYTAQQLSSSVYPSTMPQANDADSVMPPTPPQQSAQKSLHSFWTIKSAPISVPSDTPSMAPPPAPSNCEDCGTSFGGDGDELMDVDGSGFEDGHTCGACRKSVCSHCSVTNLGEQRRCLQCAGRKVWASGLC